MTGLSEWGLEPETGDDRCGEPVDQDQVEVVEQVDDGDEDVVELDPLSLPGDPDEPEYVVAAREAYLSARRADQQAQERLWSASEALENADGDVLVAEAKKDDVTADEKAKQWQRIAATEAVAKARRARDRADRLARVARTEAAETRAALARARARLEAGLAAATEPEPADEEVHDVADAPGEESQLYYSSVDEFVREFLVPTYRRRIDGVRPNFDDTFRWDAEWWRHPEALVRLEALWRAFEALRTDPGLGMSVWLRDHADHHMPILLSKFGPFRRSDDRNDDGDPLPYTTPPAGMFPQPGEEP